MYTIQLITFTMLVAVCYGQLPDQTDDAFQQECLDLTNKYRNLHHVPDVKIAPKLVKYAKDRCQYISKYNSGHVGLDRRIGENLFAAGVGSTDPDFTGAMNTSEDAVTNWYNENQFYDYNTYESIDPEKEVGHFTQLVWKFTTHMGCARCYGQTGPINYKTTIVCNYTPRGNLVFNGRKTHGQNVFPQ
ncbi:uncharacterized protein LOC128965030 [Oppia nitens]|uniref:uncharacterized protein LOC128965030 n=1 Tax=Oppia nitens TaxID=1686743 RepID=UPI0023DC68C7|nr:uncharacterized protein LOC128965030 [Oppia nitens]